MLQRTIFKITRSHWHQGFLGAGHRASAVFEGIPYTESDPFIVFMDDKLNLAGGSPVGGAHPHAGFETLTLVLQGNDKDWKTGSFELMTAGKGIVHTEEITSQENLHILQVWLALPPEKRWTQPLWQRILVEDVPTCKKEGYEIRVYSGSSQGLTSPIKNLTPLTLVDFRLDSDQTVEQEIPADQNGLVYVLEGSVQIGDQTVSAGQAGWLNHTSAIGSSTLTLRSRHEATHLVLYAAQPHHAPIVSHGPFVGDTMDDIARLYNEYRNGKMPHVKNLPDDRKLELKGYS